MKERLHGAVEASNQKREFCTQDHIDLAKLLIAEGDFFQAESVLSNIHIGMPPVDGITSYFYGWKLYSSAFATLGQAQYLQRHVTPEKLEQARNSYSLAQQYFPNDYAIMANRGQILSEIAAHRIHDLLAKNGTGDIPEIGFATLILQKVIDNAPEDSEERAKACINLLLHNLLNRHHDNFRERGLAYKALASFSKRGFHAGVSIQDTSIELSDVGQHHAALRRINSLIQESIGIKEFNEDLYYRRAKIVMTLCEKGEGEYQPGSVQYKIALATAICDLHMAAAIHTTENITKKHFNFVTNPVLGLFNNKIETASEMFYKKPKPVQQYVAAIPKEAVSMQAPTVVIRAANKTNGPTPPISLYLPPLFEKSPEFKELWLNGLTSFERELVEDASRPIEPKSEPFKQVATRPTPPQSVYPCSLLTKEQSPPSSAPPLEVETRTSTSSIENSNIAYTAAEEEHVLPSVPRRSKSFTERVQSKQSTPAAVQARKKEAAQLIAQ